MRMLLTAIIAGIILFILAIIFIIKKLRWSGILGILLVIECIAVFIYCRGDILESREIQEGVTFTDISYEKATDDNGNEGYNFLLTLTNEGSSTEKVKIVCKDENGENVTNTQVSIYQNISATHRLRSKMLGECVVPPGTQTTLKFFVTKENLEKVHGEAITFKEYNTQESIDITLEQLGL